MVSVVYRVFAGAPPASRPLPITSALIVPRKAIQLAPVDIDEIQPGCFSKLHIPLFCSTCDIPESAQLLSNDSTDFQSPDGLQRLTVSNQRSIGVRHSKGKFALQTQDKTDIASYLLSDQKRSSLNQSWHLFFMHAFQTAQALRRQARPNVPVDAIAADVSRFTIFTTAIQVLFMSVDIKYYSAIPFPSMRIN